MDEIRTKYGEYLIPALCFVTGMLIGFLLSPVKKGKITLFSNMVVFSSYAMQVIMSFLMLAMIFIMYPRAAVSAERINEVIETESNIKDGNIIKENKKYLDSEIYIKNAII